MKNLFQQAQDASISLAQIDNETINRVLNAIADAAIAHTDEILEAAGNETDEFLQNY